MLVKAAVLTLHSGKGENYQKQVREGKGTDQTENGSVDIERIHFFIRVYAAV